MKSVTLRALLWLGAAAAIVAAVGILTVPLLASWLTA